MDWLLVLTVPSALIASAALFGMALRLRPIRWFFRTLVSDPAKEAFQRNVSAVTTPQIDALHKCIERRDEAMIDALGTVSPSAAAVYSRTLNSKR